MKSSYDLIYSKKISNENEPFEKRNEFKRNDFYIEQFRIKDLFNEVDYARLQRLRNKALKIKKFQNSLYRP